MGRRLRGLVGALKDRASLSKAVLLFSSATPTITTTTTTTTTNPVSDPHLAVIRATTHHPSDEPPHPRHIATLLSFGHASRLSAATLVHGLTSRLLSTRNASVALKSLLSIHHLLSHGAFILQDQLFAALHTASGRRNPLNLSAFRDASSSDSWALSFWVRWYARVLELRLSAAWVLGTFLNPTKSPKGEEQEEEVRASWVSSLLNQDLIKELDSLVGLVEETCRAPDTSAVEGNRLVGEVVRLVEEDRITAQHHILVRVREMMERLGGLGFADSVELVCLLRRLEECKDLQPSARKRKVEDWFWCEVEVLRDRAGAVVLTTKEEEERRMTRRGRGSESARLVDRSGNLGSSEPLRFGSSRWVRG